MDNLFKHSCSQRTCYVILFGHLYRHLKKSHNTLAYTHTQNILYIKETFEIGWSKEEHSSPLVSLLSILSCDIYDCMFVHSQKWMTLLVFPITVGWIFLLRHFFFFKTYLKKFRRRVQCHNTNIAEPRCLKDSDPVLVHCMAPGEAPWCLGRKKLSAAFVDVYLQSGLLIIKMHSYQDVVLGPVVVGKGIRSLTALEEDTSSVSSTHMAVPNTHSLYL